MGIATFQISSLPTNASSATTWSVSEKALYASYLAYGFNIYQDIKDKNNVWVSNGSIQKQDRATPQRPSTLDGVKQLLTLDLNIDLATFMNQSLEKVGVDTKNVAINSIIVPTINYSPNQQSILSIVATHYGMGGWQTQQSFFKLDGSRQAIDEAVSLVGFPPYGSNGNGWGNGMLDFYALAKYLSTYPIPTAQNSDCNSVKDTLLSLQSEITSIENQRVLGTDENYNKAYLKAIGQIQTLYNGWYSKNKCTSYLNTQEQQQQQQVTAQTLETNAGIISKYAAVGTQDGVGGTDYTNYVIYGVGGVILLSAIFLMLKD